VQSSVPFAITIPTFNLASSIGVELGLALLDKQFVSLRLPRSGLADTTHHATSFGAF